ncbi:hypothetical protein ALQ26_04387 [Pseudomonas amygdali pv. lachrymans]|nr:hypothetical protein ALQ26_04387 [Pseudomonas amygdali pv. lachrymans]
MRANLSAEFGKQANGAGQFFLLLGKLRHRKCRLTGCQAMEVCCEIQTGPMRIQPQ